MGSYVPIEYASVLTAGLQSVHVTIVATVRCLVEKRCFPNFSDAGLFCS